MTYGVKGELLSLLRNYLHERNQRIVLNGQISFWELIKSGLPQGSVLGPLLFLIYDDLPDNIQSTCKTFADEASLFSHAFDKYKPQSVLSNDLQVIRNWAFHWKMQFNPDPNKQAQEVYFSKKSNNENSLPVTFNNAKVVNCSTHKHLGLLLDKRLSFTEHIQSKMSKCYKMFGVIKRLSVNLPRDALLRIYKSFIRPHLDYGDIIYDKPNNESFKKKIENIQYKACIAITGAIQGTSREHLYHELGLESLGGQRWCRKLTFFYKVVNGLAQKYLAYYLNINDNRVYKTRASEHNNVKRFGTRTENFKQSFFPFCVNEWCKLDISLRKAENIKRFKSMFKDSFNLKQKSLFAIHDPAGVKLLSRLRLKFSHLNEHKFRHNFKDALSSMYDCGSETETTDHFFLRCPFFAIKRQKVLNDLLKFDPSLRNLKDELLLDIVLYNSDKYKDTVNKEILLHTIKFMKKTKRFERPLFDH